MRRRQTALFAILVAAALATSALAQEAPNAGKPKGPSLPKQTLNVATPNTYGIDYSSFYRMGASEFTSVEVGVDDYSDTYYLDPSTFRRYGTTAGASFIGTPHLPSGARVLNIYVNGCIASDGTLNGDINHCDYAGGNCLILAPFSGLAGCGSHAIDFTSADYVVDNRPTGGQLVIRLETVATDGSDSFSGVTIEYVLQVSPAPLTATFNDVPTNHPFFLYIEALVASGITAGCGNSNYCPDNPLTRGQMAVFLAKALGLHWQ